MADVRRLAEISKKDDPISALEALESSLVLPYFNANDAYMIGTALHRRLQEDYPEKAVAIDITHTNFDTLLYHSVSAPSGRDPIVAGIEITPDHDEWIRRKRNTVKRFGRSSYLIGQKYQSNSELFVSKFMLNSGVSGKNSALGLLGGDYALHGGGVPIRVRGVAGVVGVIVVSGLKQEEDHILAVEALEQFIRDTSGVEN